jgi:peptide-methionine (S)-S-oxide reductase
MIRALALALSLGLASATAVSAEEAGQAIFAGGCFWCVEADFDKVPGVLSTTSGYIGGENDNPTYENHKRYRHRQAVLIEYDSQAVTYESLLHSFFRSVDLPDPRRRGAARPRRPGLAPRALRRRSRHRL